MGPAEPLSSIPLAVPHGDPLLPGEGPVGGLPFGLSCPASMSQEAPMSEELELCQHPLSPSLG